jgi:plastocyanin
MMFTSLALALIALPAAFAYQWEVSVGAGGKLRYDPPYTYAEPGDTIKFTL